MPKLNILHLVNRLQQRIKQLENGDALEARDINALLNDAQREQLKRAWAAQQELRKKHRQPQSDDEKFNIGWKTIREVRLDIMREALAELEANLTDTLDILQQQREVKAARVFLDAYVKAKADGKNPLSAANNELQRAGFRRTDKRSIGFRSPRDLEIQNMEERIMAKIESEMSPDEREQLELARQFDEAQQRDK
jgi:hypothetical protein